MIRNGDAHSNGAIGTSKRSTALKVVLGTSLMGREGTPQVRVHDEKAQIAMLDVFQKHGHNEIDCARIYGGGSTEEMLARLDWQGRGLTMTTKLIPLQKGPFSYSHTTEGIRTGFEQSAKALRTDVIDTWYLHLPDHATDYEETLAAVDVLYRAGRFRRFGISCFSAWEVARICELCRTRGWKMPDVYSGLYNPIQRAVEPELFPCLRHYGIAFYAFRPLGKGLLTDSSRRGLTHHGKVDPKVKVDPDAKAAEKRQESDGVEFDAVDIVRPVAQKLGIPLAEAAFRWLSHHSLLQNEHGDAVITGASSATQLEESLSFLEKGPLPDEMVQAFEKAWKLVGGSATPYFM